ncbi:MAG: hypothetical protein O7D91_01995 [Planctomycetota bacterium]|nr:hypothetical protein [Planctomycetota bacterium]
MPKPKRSSSKTPAKKDAVQAVAPSCLQKHRDDIEQRHLKAGIRSAQHALDDILKRHARGEPDKVIESAATYFDELIGSSLRAWIEDQVNMLVDYIRAQPNWRKRFRFGAESDLICINYGYFPKDKNPVAEDPLLEKLPAHEALIARGLQQPHWTFLAYNYLAAKGRNADTTILHVGLDSYLYKTHEEHESPRRVPPLDRVGFRILAFAKQFRQAGFKERQSELLERAIEKAKDDLEGLERRAGDQVSVVGPAEDQQDSRGATVEGGAIPAGQVSGNADEKPDDLMYLNVVCKNYDISKSSIYRHIKKKKLKNWPELSGNKFRLSKAEVELIYESRPTRN